MFNEAMWPLREHGVSAAGHFKYSEGGNLLVKETVL